MSRASAAMSIIANAESKCIDAAFTDKTPFQDFCYRPQLPTIGRQAPQPQSQVSCARSWLTASLQQQAQGSCSRASVPATGSEELQSILQNTTSHQDSTPTTFLGVSPPLRGGYYGGAANPLAHDTNWKRTAYNASHTNLQALRELDSTGLSFLTSQLLVGSPKSLSSDGSWCERRSVLHNKFSSCRSFCAM